MKKQFFTLLMIVFIFISCKKDESNPSNTVIIPIAGLFSETGELAYLGLTSEAAIQLAIDDINQYLRMRQYPYRFSFTAYDTGLIPANAVDHLSNIAQSGCKLVIGPNSSAELAAIKPLADSLGILVISPSSTAASLALPNDMIFRFSPGQSIVGGAMGQWYTDQGKQALVTISRNDIGSIGLQSAAIQKFVENGGITVDAGVFEGTDTDFSTVLQQVKNEIQNLNTQYTLNQIGVLTTSWDETTLLFEQAANDPVLASVDWFGGVGYFKNQSLLSNPTAAQFAFNTQFTSPGFSLPMTTQNKWEELLNNIFANTGYRGDALTLCAYDAMHCLAQMIEDENGLPPNALALRNSFHVAAQSYNGITGNIVLDDNGDRANGTFDFYGLQNNNGTLQWTLFGQSE